MKDKGFSIIQVMISMGLLTGLIVAGFKILENQTQVGKSSSLYFESLNMVDEIKTILSNKKACALTFENKSAFYETIDHIFSANQGEGEVEYRVHVGGKPAYGQSNILLERIELNGNAPELGTEKGTTLVKLTFREKESKSEKVSFEFPLHVETNEMDRILSCFSLPGINGALGNNDGKKLWSHSKSKAEHFIKANSSQVLVSSESQRINEIGQAGLVVKGGIKIGEDIHCDKKYKELISYRKDEDHLYWCNDNGEWEVLDQDKELVTSYRDFDFSPKGKEVNTHVTREDFQFCEVRDTFKSPGICWARAIEAEQTLGKWELVSQYLRGEGVHCSFRCYQ
ncbi:MAG: hypothetical protein CME63_05445 [Halobacteriovoraceae bacterium]|nr:hypothetical protein [Halobacteriovoraceae bacterium]|tara:strand:+ start:113410 stop:114429 length:1020 start_codon:yes stop_codon:yes gene_type:complete